MSPGTSVAILCGGPSRRFGAEKAHAMAGERTLVEWIVSRLEGVTDDLFCQLCPGATAPPGLPAHQDPWPGCGPKSGIHGALLNARHPWVFVCASDMPAVDPRLVGILGRQTEGVEAVVPRWENGWLEPMCALYSKGALAAVASQLGQGVLRLSDLLTAVDGVSYVHVEPLVLSGGLDQDCFLNINSRDELDRWVASRGLGVVSPTVRAV